MTARSRATFKQLVTLPDLGIPLAEAALLMACEEYPQLSLSPYLDELDHMGQRVRERLGRSSSAIATIEAINQVLFVEYGFEGNTKNYYDPRNSFLNDVIERRTGIPITLSAIYIEVANRVGLKIDGVGVPGHFVVKHTSPTDEVFVDPFNQGSVLSREECRTRLLPERPENGHREDFWLRRVTNRQIVTRMLANLRAIYFQAQTLDKALVIPDLMVLADPDVLSLYRERGLLRLRLRKFDAAARDLRWYLRNAPPSADNSTLEGYLKDVDRLRATRN